MYVRGAYPGAVEVREVPQAAPLLLVFHFISCVRCVLKIRVKLVYCDLTLIVLGEV